MARAKAEHTSIWSDWLEMPLVTGWGWSAKRSATMLKHHVNEGYEITYASEGEFRWEVYGQGTLILRGGQVCLTQSRVPHHAEGDVFSPGTLFFLKLTNRDLQLLQAINYHPVTTLWS